MGGKAVGIDFVDYFGVREFLDGGQDGFVGDEGVDGAGLDEGANGGAFFGGGGCFGDGDVAGVDCDGSCGGREGGVVGV